MKHDAELFRNLLLYIEEKSDGPLGWVSDIQLSDYTNAQIMQHLWWLKDGGFISAADATSSDGVEIIPRCLTYSGVEFLDSVRAKDVWQRTIEVAKQGGVESLDALWQIAKRVAQSKVEKLLGAA